MVLSDSLCKAKFFTESRLLQRSVRVVILSLPHAMANPFQSSTSATPPASILIGMGECGSFKVSLAISPSGIVLHPAGNVAEHLLANGLARIVEWHAGMLSSRGGMERLRSAEKSAKEKRLNLFANQTVMVSNVNSHGALSIGLTRVFDATVIRVWSGDQVSVIGKEDSTERRLQLSSTRGPKCVRCLGLTCLLGS